MSKFSSTFVTTFNVIYALTRPRRSPDSSLMHAGICSSTMQTLNRFSGRRKCMDGCFLKMISLCLRLEDSGGLSCFCTQRKSTDIIPPKTDWLTDWPSFEFWFWLLLITLFKSCLFMFRVDRCRRCVVDWDGTGAATDLQNLMLGLKQCGASVKKKWRFSERIFDSCSVWIHVQANDA